MKIKPNPKFIEIISKIDKEKPSEEELKEVELYLSENRTEYLALQKLSRNLISNQIKKTFSTSEALRDDLTKGAEALRFELGYSASSSIEQLLIDEIILEFLRMHQMQLSLSELTSRPGTQWSYT